MQRETDISAVLPAVMVPTLVMHRTDDAALLRFLRFRPPLLERTAEGVSLSLPHIRLDQTLQYLIGDKLK